MHFIWPQTLVWAAAQTTGQGGATGQDAPFNPLPIAIVLILIAFYFMLLRPQKRERDERSKMLEGIAKGDRIMTSSGMYGTVESLDKETVTLSIAPKVSVEFNRAAIAQVIKKKNKGAGDKPEPIK